MIGPVPNTPRSRTAAVAVAAAALALLVFAGQASAVSPPSFVWTGSAAPGAGTWSSASNWSGGGAPSGEVGDLTFNKLTSPECMAVPPTAACYMAYNDVAGLTVGGITFGADAPYVVSGNEITLGANGITAAATKSIIMALPVKLGASQEWSVSGILYGPGSLYLRGGMTAVSHALTVNQSDGGLIRFAGNTQLGPLTFTGTDTSKSGFGAIENGLTALEGGVNSTSGNPIVVSRSLLVSDGATTGPLTMNGASLQVGLGNPGTINVAGALALDGQTGVSMFIQSSGTQGGVAYSQIRATGDIDLGGARLNLRQYTGGCPTLTADTVQALVTAQGAVSGTFEGLPDGATTPISCGVAGTGATYRINYTPHTVTATVLGDGGLLEPDAPGAPSVSAGDGQVTVSWNAPGADGGTPVTSYTVTASPGAQTCTWTSGPLQCTVTGLSNGTTYTFTVKAMNSVGSSPTSPASAQATPKASSVVQPPVEQPLVVQLPGGAGPAAQPAPAAAARLRQLPDVLRVSGGRVSITCVASAGFVSRCSASLSARGKTIATARGTGSRLRLKLTAVGRKLLRASRGKLKAKITLTAQSPGGPVKLTKNVTLRT